MNGQIKSEFEGYINGVYIDWEKRYYDCCVIIQEIEERLEIDIYDEDFVVFINHVLDEFDHNARYVEKDCDAQAIISNYIINVMTNDIDFDYEYKRVVEKVEDFNKTNNINTNLQGYWNGATIFEMLEMKTVRAYSHNIGADNLDKFIENYPFKPVTYEDLFNIFKLRFKERFDEYMKS
jgi:hypothetical protein